MFCSKCGSEVGEKSRFCGKCGNPTAQSTEKDTKQESFQGKEETKKALPMNWYWFVTYISMPFVAFWSIIGLFMGDIWALPIAIVCPLLWYGLRKYKAWALYLLLVVQVLNAFGILLPIGSYVTTTDIGTSIGPVVGLVLGFIVSVCNFVYFYKRRHLFK